MSNLVKCNNCNIIICEVLSFIQNKCGLMDEDGLVCICASAFKVEEIESAKNLLFESVPTRKRNITRRREGKAQRDLVDIIYLMKNTRADDMPIFVAKELHRLPPVTWDHIDATRLLRDITVLKEEFKDIVKCNNATIEQVKGLKNELDILKNTSVVNNNFDFNVNTKRGACKILSNSYSCDSGPMGLTHIELNRSDVSNNTSCDDSCPQRSSLTSNGCEQSQEEGIFVAAHGAASKTTDADESSRAQPSTHPTVSETAISNGAAREKRGLIITKLQAGVVETSEQVISKLTLSSTDNNPMSPKSRTMVDIVSVGEWKREESSEPWTEVTKRRNKHVNRFVGRVGKAQTNTNSKFRAANNMTKLFISNVHTETKAEDISEYIFETTQVSVMLEKVEMKRQKRHNSYKFSVPSHKLRLFLDDNLWPDGISFRKYIHFRPRINEETFNAKK